MQAPLAEVTTQFGGVEARALQHHSEPVSRVPSLRILLGDRNHLPLQALGLTQIVRGSLGCAAHGRSQCSSGGGEAETGAGDGYATAKAQRKLKL